jgi:2-keto-4-pentenoate hydratase/2-oxohepta-3-ene-1,7-dioic acid hydratase in catechol pathway
MPLVRFRRPDGAVWLGWLQADSVREIAEDAEGTALNSLLQGGQEAARSAFNRASEAAHETGDVKFLAPLTRPPKVIAIGLNYEGHRLETKGDEPTEPTVFSKFASSIIGPDQEIRLPAAAPRRVDYEAELAVVLAGGGRDVAESDAMSLVAGYTIANDVSARDWQVKKPNGQWLLGKTFDTFLPLGPVLVTTDEVVDPHALRITCSISGELVQDASTSELIFRIPYLISYLSRVFRLEPGDVILTGTPAGVGMARTPPRWLADGDVVEINIEGIGTLRNPVRGPSR